jgi:hypothetical protein
LLEEWCKKFGTTGDTRQMPTLTGGISSVCRNPTRVAEAAMTGDDDDLKSTNGRKNKKAYI